MSFDNTNDLDVIEAINNGNKERFGEIMDRYAPVVFYVARRFERDEERVRETAHEIFLKVYEKLNTFKSESAFSSWIYQVAMNFCRDQVKMEKRRTHRTDNLEDNTNVSCADEEPNPESGLINTEMAGLLNRSIKKLPPEYAMPLEMKYREGLNHKEIAEILQVSENTLKVRIHRARVELRKIMESSI